MANSIIKRMDLAEFRDEGYLFELNRVFLHPLGLALELGRDGDGVTLSGIWDCRDDPEGIVFDKEALDPAKVKRVETLWLEREPARMKALGYVIQPVEGA